MTTDKPRRITNVEQMYDLWVGGMSTRAIGRLFGFSHVAVYKAINRRYGEGVTSAENSSMLRSLVSDYGVLPDELILKVSRVKGNYYSQKTMDGYSRNWGKYLPNYDYTIDNGDEPVVELGWYYLYTILNYIVEMLLTLQG